LFHINWSYFQFYMNFTRWCIVEHLNRLLFLPRYSTADRPVCRTSPGWVPETQVLCGIWKWTVDRPGVNGGLSAVENSRDVFLCRCSVLEATTRGPFHVSARWPSKEYFNFQHESKLTIALSKLIELTFVFSICFYHYCKKTTRKPFSQKAEICISIS